MIRILKTGIFRIKNQEQKHNLATDFHRKYHSDPEQSEGEESEFEILRFAQYDTLCHLVKSCGLRFFLMYHSQTAPAKPFNCKGFTLIELLLVILIIGIILTTALPKISYFEDISVRRDTRQIAGLIRYLNEAAATKKLYYRVSFDMEKMKIKVEYSKDGFEYKDETESAMKGLSLGDMIEIEDIVLPGLGKIRDGEAIVIFSPYGYSEPFNLHLKGLGRFFTLSFNPYTDKVKIEEGYV